MTKKILLLGFLLTLIIFSCKKYEDGPTISLLTKQSRLINKWKPTETATYIEKSQPGQTVDTTYPSISANYIEFAKHNKYYTPSDTGQWEFYDNKNDIILTVNQEKDTFKILRLKSKELWLKINSDTGDVIQKYTQFE